jgi:hypothetical protein
MFPFGYFLLVKILGFWDLGLLISFVTSWNLFHLNQTKRPERRPNLLFHFYFLICKVIRSVVSNF